MQLKFITTYLLITGTFFACNSPTETNKKIEIQEFPYPIIIDSNKYEVEAIDVKRLYHGSHYPMYFGDLKDTIYINHSPEPLDPPPPPEFGSNENPYVIEKGEYDDYFLDWMSFRDYKGWDSGDSVKFDIQIDTIQVISNKGRKAYPVLIQNLHSDTVYIGYGSHIPLITEALNEKGNWQPIEHQYVYICGVGLRSFILPPKQYVITSVLVYTGEYKTKLRIKYGNNYSGVYTGSINKTQFELK